MLNEKINTIFPLHHSIFFQPFPIFSPNVHITTAENGTIMITFSISFLKIVLHAFAQNNDLVRIFRSIFFALVNKLRAKS